MPEWLPGATFQREARVWKTSVEKMRHVPFNVVKEGIVRGLLWSEFDTRVDDYSQAAGRAPDCVATSLLETMARNTEDYDYMEDIIRSTLGSMYAGMKLHMLSDSVQ